MQATTTETNNENDVDPRLIEAQVALSNAQIRIANLNHANGMRNLGFKVIRYHSNTGEFDFSPTPVSEKVE